VCGILHSGDSVTNMFTFSVSRGFFIHAWGKDKVGPGEKISASAIAGGIGGTAGGLLREYFASSQTLI